MIYAIIFASIFTLSFYALKELLKKLLIKKPVVIETEESRNSPEYRKWRDEVLKRDEYKCLWCKVTNNLEAHHIYSYKAFPEFRLDIKNGLTLCSNCHKLTPNYGSKQKAFDKKLKESIANNP